MKSAKTTGGIKNFITHDSTYEKWVLTRSFQARFVDALLRQVSLQKTDDDPRKCLRESEINRSEKNVKDIMSVMMNDFSNLFSQTLDHNKLYNLASGCPVPDEISDNLLSIQELGEYLREEFYKRLQVGSENQDMYFSPIKRVQWKGFTSVGKKVRISAGGKSKEVTAQRDILGLLAAKSQQHDAAINIDKALCYPLTSVPLAMATCDGARRKTAKSKLLTASLKSSIENDEEIPQTRPENKIYILDLAAKIRSMGNILDTVKDLALQLLCDVPKQYNTIYIACDILHLTLTKFDPSNAANVVSEAVVIDL